MTSPRHLWSGDWRRDSDAAADELARRRAQGVAADRATEAPAEAPEPVRWARGAAAPPRPRPEPIRRLRGPAAPPQRRSERVEPARERVESAREPARESLLARASAAVGRGFASLKRIPAPTSQQRRVLLLIALGALVVVGAAYGLAALGGSGSSPAALTTGRPWLGVELSQPPGGGVIVGTVAPGGPGDRAGIQPGDVIMAVGNRPVSSPGDVESAIDNLSVGAHVPITVLRGASSYTTLVRLAGTPVRTP